MLVATLQKTYGLSFTLKYIYTHIYIYAYNYIQLDWDTLGQSPFIWRFVTLQLVMIFHSYVNDKRFFKQSWLVIINTCMILQVLACVFAYKLMKLSFVFIYLSLGDMPFFYYSSTIDTWREFPYISRGLCICIHNGKVATSV